MFSKCLNGWWTHWPQVYWIPVCHFLSLCTQVCQWQAVFATEIWQRFLLLYKWIVVVLLIGLYISWSHIGLTWCSNMLKATCLNCRFHLWCLALKQAFMAYSFQIHNTQPLFHTFLPTCCFSLSSSPSLVFSVSFFLSVWKLLRSWMVRARMKSSCLYIIIFSFYLF